MAPEELILIKEQNILPTEVAVPKECLSALHEALMDYLGIDTNEFIPPPKREGTQFYLQIAAPDLPHSIDEWYVDLKEYKFTFDDVLWLGNFWRDHINSKERFCK